jgi:hypothetical protein
MPEKEKAETETEGQEGGLRQPGQDERGASQPPRFSLDESKSR